MHIYTHTTYTYATAYIYMHVPTYYRAQLGWSINQRPMSKRLEHRLREKFNKVDGSSGTHAHTRSFM